MKTFIGVKVKRLDAQVLFMGRGIKAVAVLLSLLASFAACHLTFGEAQDLEFEVLLSGDLSGYVLEKYIVVRTVDVWNEVWENHNAPLALDREGVIVWNSCAVSMLDDTCSFDVDFSRKMVVCAFMGERRTAGYSISVERIWVVNETMHVQVPKHSPPQDKAVAQVITYPYVFAAVETNDLDVVFEVVEEDGSMRRLVLPEISAVAAVIFLALLSSLGVALKHVFDLPGNRK